MNQAEAAVPPLPPKKPKRPPSPPTAAAVNGATVPSKTVTLVDLFHGDGGGEPKSHVVKILINPRTNGSEVEVDKGGVVCDVSSCVRISLGGGGGGDMIQKENQHVGVGGGGGGGGDVQPGSYFYYGPFNYGVMSSGQVSPSDTLDSGTCSDLDGTPPTPMKKKNGGVSVTMIGQHKRAPSSSSGAEVDSDDNESNISCDSLNSGKLSPISPLVQNPATTATILPQMLLQDIRQRSASKPTFPKIDEKPYVDRKKEKQLQRQLEEEEKDDVVIDTDMFYKFHINENFEESVLPVRNVIENETFAGYRDLLGNDGASTIRSAKGTVRGVKNRVRAGIATFLQINNATIKNYKEKEAGKVVVYTTTMGILRDTYQACMKVKQILRTLLVKYEERDVFMSSEYQTEIQERMRCDQVLVPQVFLEGVHIGDAETIERLNETGELRRLLKPFRSKDVCNTCQVCGGFRLLPCQICKGSKKSVHRNHFTTEFVALKCMNCDEVGLVKCSSCS